MPRDLKWGENRADSASARRSRRTSTSEAALADRPGSRFENGPGSRIRMSFSESKAAMEAPSWSRPRSAEASKRRASRG